MFRLSSATAYLPFLVELLQKIYTSTKPKRAFISQVFRATPTHIFSASLKTYRLIFAVNI